MNATFISKSFLALVLGSVVAVGNTTVQGMEIRDGGEFFSQKTRDKANSQIDALQKDHALGLRIVTVKGVPASQVEEVERMEGADRARFFEKWGREMATSEQVRGIFILVCRNPGYVQVEVDRQSRERGFGTTERQELRNKLVAGMRNKDPDQGLLEGVEYVSHIAKTRLKQASGKGAASPTGRRADRRAARGAEQAPADQGAKPGGLSWLNWLIIAVVVFLGIRLILAIVQGLTGGGGGGYYGAPGMGGGGFLGSLMTGMLGAFAGNWLYHSLFDNHAYGGDNMGMDDQGNFNDGAGEDFQGSGGDFDDPSGGMAESDGGFGGDWGGGGFGGGDFGGGDFGGGDF
ncbi:MAG: TPM domain-containing protein [Planctomycetales bacterium]